MSLETFLGWGLAMTVVAWTAVVGLGWAWLLRPRADFVERLGLGYLIGLALVVSTLLGWQLSGRPYERTPLLLISVVLAALPWLLIIGLRSSHAAGSPAAAARLPDRVLAAAIGLVVGLNLAVATYQPTLRWDELSHHMFAAKIFFHEGGITRESGMLTQDVRTYPPFVPLTRVWLYELVGSDNPAPNHLVSWAMFASFLAAFNARLRDFVSSSTSLVFTLMASLLLFWGGTESLIDFPLIAYGGLGVLTAAAVLGRREPRLALVAGLLLGMGGLVRPDGLGFGLLNLGLFAFFAVFGLRQMRAFWLVAMAALGLVAGMLPWVVFKSVFWGSSLSPDTYLGGNFGDMVFAAIRSGSLNLDALWQVVSYAFPEYNRQYGYVMLLAILLIPLGLPDRRPNGFLCAALLINAAVYITALYAFLVAGRTDLALRDETAIRFGTRLLPLLIFTIGSLPLVDEAVIWAAQLIQSYRRPAGSSEVVA